MRSECLCWWNILIYIYLKSEKQGMGDIRSWNLFISTQQNRIKMHQKISIALFASTLS